MSVSAIQSQRLYTALASGKRINSAADDAAGLAISFIGPVLTLYISRLIKPVDFMLYPQKYIHLK